MEPTRPTLAFVPVHTYAALVDELVERGHARAAVLASAGLAADALAQHGGHLALAQLDALVTRACALVPAHELGLAVAARVSVMSHGSLGVAALSAATIHAAIGVVAEHFALVSPLVEPELDVREGGLVLRMRTRWTSSPELERYHVALGTGLFAHLPRLLCPGAVQQIDVDGPELRIPSAIAELRSTLADVRVHADALRQCRARLDARPDPTEMAATVRRVLIASGAPFPDLDAIAKRLATSSRSLRRRLREEGTSFRVLLDDVRSTIADAWLDDPRRSITEIGFDLGYTDAANFARAYRRANGVSPSAARRQRLGLEATA